MNYIALLVVLFGAALSSPIFENQEWEAWKKFHEKTYESVEEEAYRKDIWHYNLKVSSHRLKQNLARKCLQSFISRPYECSAIFILLVSS